MAISPDIGYLADRPEALPVLERLFQTEWPDYYGADGPGDARQDLLAYSSRNHLPVGLVAFVGPEPCGVVALKSESITTHKHFSPWVAGGMVAPQYRGYGIGAQMALALEEVARSLGFKVIYSGTSTANSLLLREGWQFIELVLYNGEEVSIYEKVL
ncbi:GNAT family N-acetyltransferase [Microbulbifer celer]|nr:GNAT family N-acetyltransferase [Microbulbifer celer]UFN57222.1 GNAT family N-acetyltransferase [Microbulbifer celer]